MISNSNVSFLEMTNDAFFCWSRLGTNNQEFLLVLNQQVNKLIELTEWRVGDNHIIVAVINILKTYSFVRFGIISAYTNRTDARFLSLIQKIVNKLAFHQIHSFFYLLASLGYVYIFDSSLCAE